MSKAIAMLALFAAYISHSPDIVREFEIWVPPRIMVNGGNAVGVNGEWLKVTQIGKRYWSGTRQVHPNVIRASLKRKCGGDQ